MARFGSHGGGYSVPPALVRAGEGSPFDRLRVNGGFWIPAFAGMTEGVGMTEVGGSGYDSDMSTTLLSWNVNGLRAVNRKGEFPAILSNISPDILCMQETKSQPDQLTKAILEVEGYEAHFASAERKG